MFYRLLMHGTPGIPGSRIRLVETLAVTGKTFKLRIKGFWVLVITTKDKMSINAIANVLQCHRLPLVCAPFLVGAKCVTVTICPQWLYFSLSISP